LMGNNFNLDSNIGSVFFALQRAGHGQELYPYDYVWESFCASGDFVWYIEELDLCALIDHEDFDCLYGPCTLAQLEEYYREIHESDESEEAVGNDDVANSQPDSSGAQQAIQIDPNDADAHNDLGVAYSGQGQLEQAIAAYQQAIQIDPNEPIIYTNLGAAYSEQGQLEQAIAAFQQALQIDPNYSEAHNSLADIQGRKLKKSVFFAGILVLILILLLYIFIFR